METEQWCQLCFNPLDPEGAFQLGSCGHTFHVGCIQQSAVHCMQCPQRRVPLPQRFYKLFGLQIEMPTSYEFNEWNFPLDHGPHRFMNFTQWRDKLKREPTLTEWDSMSWMTFDYEVEIRAQSIDDAAKRCRVVNNSTM
jgi:hypothetical protein